MLWNDCSEETASFLHTSKQIVRNQVSTMDWAETVYHMLLASTLYKADFFQVPKMCKLYNVSLFLKSLETSPS